MWTNILGFKCESSTGKLKWIECKKKKEIIELRKLAFEFDAGECSDEVSGMTLTFDISERKKSIWLYGAIHQKSVADSYNKVKLCDQTNWKKGKRDLFDIDCTSVVDLSRCDTVHTIFTIDEGKLYFGKADEKNSGKTKKLRHGELEKEYFFEKE